MQKFISIFVAATFVAVTSSTFAVARENKQSAEATKRAAKKDANRQESGKTSLVKKRG